MRALWSFDRIIFSYKYDAMGETLTLSVKKETLVSKSIDFEFSLVLEKNNQE